MCWKQSPLVLLTRRSTDSSNSCSSGYLCNVGRFRLLISESRYALSTQTPNNRRSQNKENVLGSTDSRSRVERQVSDPLRSPGNDA